MATDREALIVAAKWLHAAYDRPPQTPECKAMLEKIDLALSAALDRVAVNFAHDDAGAQVSEIARRAALAAPPVEQQVPTLTIAAAGKTFPNGPFGAPSIAQATQPAAQAGAAESTDDFRNGAKAMFDSLLFRAANNWHGDPAVNAACDAENKVIESWAAEALEDVSPEDHTAWKAIGTAYAQGVEAGRKASHPTEQPSQDAAWQKISDEVALILSDPDSEISRGAKRALDWIAARAAQAQGEKGGA